MSSYVCINRRPEKVTSPRPEAGPMGIFDRKSAAPAKRSHHKKQTIPRTTFKTMNSFFIIAPPLPPKPGRPAGIPFKKRGRPAASPSIDE